MKHYVVLAKSYTINEAGDETLDDVNLLTVEHFKGDALDTIASVRQEYINDDYVIENAEDNDENGGIIVTTGEDTVDFYIHIYYEEVD